MVSQCACGCHQRGMIECGQCCKVYQISNKTTTPITQPDVVLDRCEKCGGAGILLKLTPTYLKVIKIQKVCDDCSGKGYVERMVMKNV